MWSTVLVSFLAAFLRSRRCGILRVLVFAALAASLGSTAALAWGRPSPASRARAPVPDCDSLYASSHRLLEEAYGPINRTWIDATPEHREGFRALHRAARDTRRCYQEQYTLRDTSPPDSASAERRRRVALTYRQEGYGLAALKRFEDAFERYRRFFERFGQTADAGLLHDMAHFQAYLHMQVGDYPEAIALSQRAATYAEGLPEEKSLLTRARRYQDIGVLSVRVGDYPTATRAAKISLRILGRADSTAPRTLRLRARSQVLYASGRHGAVEARNGPGDSLYNALRLARESLSTLDSPVLRRALPPALLENQRARTLTGIAESELYLGNTEAAGRALDQARSAATHFERVGFGGVLEGLAGVLHTRTGRFTEAEAAFRQALAHIKTDPAQRNLDAALTAFGKVYERQGAPARAAEQYRQAIKVVEKQRASLRATDWSSIAFDEWKAPYRGLVRVLLMQGKDEEAFRTLAQTRARHLRDLRMRSRLVNGFPRPRRVRFDSLTVLLNSVRDSLQDGAAAPDGRASLEQRRLHLVATRRAMLDLPPLRDSLALGDVQAALRPRQRALFSYFVDDRQGSEKRETRSHVFVVTADTLRAIPLSTTGKQIGQAMRSASPLLTQDVPRASLGNRQFDLQALHHLYEDLWEPARSFVRPGQPVTVIPDGPLYRLPFGALARRAPSRFAPEDAEFVVRRHPLSTGLSASLVASQGNASTPPSSALDFAAFGKARFEKDAYPASVDTLAPLAGVTREVRNAASLFQRSRVFLNDAATEEAFYQTAERDPTVLHLASHTIAHPRRPLSSVFVLSPSSPADSSPLPGTRDGLIHFHELQSRLLSAGLVTLSACKTARGQLHSGEGMQSLQYAFRATGVGSTISQLWQAEDVSSATLTELFYRHLLDGKPRDVALQQAQLALLDGDDGSHRGLFFWAGTQLYGSPSTLALAPATPLWGRPWNVALSTVFLFVLCAGALLYRRLHAPSSPAST